MKMMWLKRFIIRCSGENMKVNLTREEINNIIHILEYDNEQWVDSGIDEFSGKYVKANDSCLKKLCKVVKK